MAWTPYPGRILKRSGSTAGENTVGDSNLQLSASATLTTLVSPSTIKLGRTAPPERPRASQSGPVSPETSAGPLSRSTFWWLNNLFKLGYKRQIQEHDLYEMLDQNKAHVLKDCLSECWKAEQDQARIEGKKPMMLRAIVKAFWKRQYFACVCLELGDLCQILTPLLLKPVVHFIHNSNTDTPPPVWHGYGLAMALLLVCLLQTLLYQTWTVSSKITGINIRTSLVDMVFRKATSISSRSHLIYPDGAMVNMMSTDATRIDLAILSATLVASVPIYTMIIIGILIHIMGLSALVGAFILIMVNPVQGWAMSKLAPIRRRASEFTDQRIRLTTEILQGIKIIKFFAWEARFAQKLSEIREKEMYHVGRLLFIRGMVAAASGALPVFASALSLVLYASLGNNLRVDVVFPALAYFTALRAPLLLVSAAYTTTADAYVGMKRIEKFLLSEDATSIPPPALEHDSALTIRNAYFLWERLDTVSTHTGDKAMTTATLGSQSEKSITDQSFHLRDINLEVPRGSLVLVVGPVGSGKSSLLQAAIGNMVMSTGKAIRGTTISYATQTAWMRNATVRDNILFGTPFDEARYWRVVRACSLEHDLACLPDGDQTEIGERGANLSGGQKARISMARAVYFEAGMIIMDDPLSAVDAHVGKRLWEDCVLGELRDRARIIATHQLHLVQDADHIIFMKNGTIGEQGSYAELMNMGGDFSALMVQYGGCSEDSSDTNEKDVPELIHDHEELTISTTAAKEFLRSVHVDFDDGMLDTALTKVDEGLQLDSDCAYKTKPTACAPLQLMTDEEREAGAVKGRVYFGYMKASGRLLWASVFAFFLLQQWANIMGSQWIGWWSEDAFKLPFKTYIWVYVAWALVQLLFIYGAAITLSYAVVRASTVLHDRAVERILRSPLSFFDTTPMGRILNRLSGDVDTLDNVLWKTLYEFLFASVTLFGTLVLLVVTLPWLLLVIVPLLCIYWKLSVYHRTTSRELKRLYSTLRSHLYAHYAECLAGLETLKTYGAVHQATVDNEHQIDFSNRPYYLFQQAAGWVGIRVGAMGSLLTFATIALIVGTRHTINPITAGLILTYLLRFSADMSWGMQRLSNLENFMNSAERLLHYTQNLNQERPADIPDTKPDASWPSEGAISFKGVSLRYRPDLPRVLQKISLDIEPGLKVAVVGRTGAGKSSLIQALFLLSELDEGRIVIDGIDTQSIGTKDLRSRIAIIPQDPVLFQGTVRYNLDPLGKHSDQELWKVLETSDLRAYIQAQEGGLDGLVSAGGENMSVGQRQLICLSRALLAKSKIVVLDEATASADMATDALIQRAIRVDFASSTVITIAHRIKTIIDYDRVLVMQRGSVAEYDTPLNLLRNRDSLFAGMAAEAGL